MSSMCDTCHAGCCRSYFVAVSPYDMFRIRARLNVPVEQFCEFSDALTAAGPAKVDALYPIFHFADSPDPRRGFILGLKRQASAAFPGTLRCTFLMEHVVSGKQPPFARTDVLGRCGIYETRPHVCSTYPSRMHPEGLVLMLANPAPPGPTADGAPAPDAYALCPGPWTVQDFTSDPFDATHRAVLFEYEMRFFRAVAAEWNKEPASVAEALAYLERIYANRLRLVENQASAPQSLPARSAA